MSFASCQLAISEHRWPAVVLQEGSEVGWSCSEQSFKETGCHFVHLSPAHECVVLHRPSHPITAAAVASNNLLKLMSEISKSPLI